MRPPPFLLVVLALIQEVSADPQDYYDYGSVDIHELDNFTVDERNVNVHAIHGTLQHFHECRDKKWSCDKHCRLEFRQKSGKCLPPYSHDKCFGIPIGYRYTRDHDIERFPSELGVLRRYPRCWSYLGPLVCATLFRPCSRHHFIEKTNGIVKNGTIELWQLLSTSMCDKAMQMCDEVISSGFFPSFVHCQVVNNGSYSGIRNPIYSSECQHDVDDYPVKVEDGVCPWPLVSEPTTLGIDSSPLLDECYLPCRSPLVSSSLSNRSRSFRFVICAPLAALFFSESIFLSRFCKSFSESLSLFYISHSVISAAAYCLIWSLSFSDTFFTLSDCSVDGVSRRFALSHSIFEWCSLQSIILYSSFLAAFIWIVLLYINAICPSTMFLMYFSPRSLRSNSRLFLIFCVYGVSVIISFFVMSGLRENDGVTGVCHNGLVTWWKYVVSVFPLMCLASCVIGFIPVILLKRKDVLRTLAVRHALIRLNKAEERERIEKLPRFELSDGEILAHHCGGVNGPVRIDVNSIEDRNLLRNPLHEMFTNEYRRSYRSISRRICHERSFGLSVKWTGASFILFMSFLIGSPVIHYHYVAMPARYEETSIIGYVTCNVAHAIRNRSMEWITQKEYPSPFASDAPWCSLPFERARARLEGILMVFIILPIAPFLVLLVAFLAGINGYGGIRKKHGSGSLMFSMLSPENPGPCEAIPMKTGFRHSPGIENTLSLNPGDPKTPCLVNVDETLDKSQLDNCIAEAANVSEGECDRESQKECQEELSLIVDKLREELSFQHSMLVTDGAAWNISLCYLQRTEHILSMLQTSENTGGKLFKELQTLGEEMTRVLPSVSSHVIQLSRWMGSLREACLRLEQIQSNTDDDLSCRFGSEDISRQQQLTTLHEQLMRIAASSSRHQEPLVCSTNAEESAVQKNLTQNSLPSHENAEQRAERTHKENRKHPQHHNLFHDQEPGPSCEGESAAERAPLVDRRSRLSVDASYRIANFSKSILDSIS